MATDTNLNQLVINKLTQEQYNTAKNAGQIVETELYMITDSGGSIPTKTSELENDSGFITSDAVPTKTSELTNDSGFITSAPVTSVNSKTGAVSLSASDVGARPNTWTPTASDVGAVPTTRTVNGKALSSNITLSASDVGAATTAAVQTAQTTANEAKTAANEAANAVSSKAPMYGYGTEDLVAGTTPLETGKLYFVYE